MQEVRWKVKGGALPGLSPAGDPKYVNESKIQPGEHEDEKVACYAICACLSVCMCVCASNTHVVEEESMYSDVPKRNLREKSDFTIILSYIVLLNFFIIKFLKISN